MENVGINQVILTVDPGTQGQTKPLYDLSYYGCLRAIDLISMPILTFSMKE